MKKQNKFPFLLPVGCCVLLIVFVLLISGCQTPNFTTAINVQPAEAAPAKLSTNEALAEVVPTTAAKPETYPVIGYVRSGEAPQLTKSDTSAIRNELRSASEQASKRGDGEDVTSFDADIEALRKRAKTHSKEALEKIEKPSR